MPIVSQSVTLNAPLQLTFHLSNRLEDWPRMMDDYKAIEILKSEGWKTWFRLIHSNGMNWVSWRVIHPVGSFALAERYEPRAPFKFMQHLWLYRELSPEETEMTWYMNFELPNQQKEKEGELSNYLLEHSLKNQATMKNYIEEQCLVLNGRN